MDTFHLEVAVHEPLVELPEIDDRSLAPVGLVDQDDIAEETPGVNLRETNRPFAQEVGYLLVYHCRIGGGKGDWPRAAPLVEGTVEFYLKPRTIWTTQVSPVLASHAGRNCASLPPTCSCAEDKTLTVRVSVVSTFEASTSLEALPSGQVKVVKALVCLVLPVSGALPPVVGSLGCKSVGRAAPATTGPLENPRVKHFLNIRLGLVEGCKSCDTFS